MLERKPEGRYENIDGSQKKDSTEVRQRADKYIDYIERYQKRRKRIKASRIRNKSENPKDEF
jgi:hypothetical protein